MIHTPTFFKSLKKYDVNLFAGVPDSLLKNFCAYLEKQQKPEKYIITANEGNAVAIAAGYHLSTGKIGSVYMQNSGLGNAVNPLTSLTDTKVYSIPLLMIIGWRGEPGKKDEPQHIKQGKITTTLLKLLEIPYWILDADSNLNAVLHDLFQTVKRTNAPVALLVRKGTFSDYKNQNKVVNNAALGREEALRKILSLVNPQDLIISTTGKTSREVFELRVERGDTQSDFLTVGSMGHTSSIALGVSIGNQNRRVICLDGDGSMLMHLGALPIIGDMRPSNFVHVLLNNQAHESVGNQPTIAGQIDFAAIAKGCGYCEYFAATDIQSLEKNFQEACQKPGPVLIELHIRTGSRSDLGRPTSSPIQNKVAFMEKACD